MHKMAVVSGDMCPSEFFVFAVLYSIHIKVVIFTFLFLYNCIARNNRNFQKEFFYLKHFL